MTLSDRLLPLARGLLAEVERVYAAAGVALPARRYVTAGPAAGIAHDDEQLVVSVASVLPSVANGGGFPAGPPAGRGYRVPVVAVRAELVRCVPVVADDGVPPSAAELDASGAVRLRDVGLLWDAALAACQPGAVAERGWPVSVVGVTGGGPSGGLAAVSVDLSVQVG